MALSPAHHQLIRLMARQAVREHLTPDTAQRQAPQRGRQNRQLHKRAAND